MNNTNRRYKETRDNKSIQASEVVLIPLTTVVVKILEATNTVLTCENC